MIQILTRNIGWKLLSLAAAVLLWISVSSEPELATVRSVSVEYKNIPDDLEISSRIDDTVDLELRGPSGRLRDLRETRPAVVLDFAAVHEPGERTFTIDRSNAIVPTGIQLVRAIPAQLRFTFEHRMSREVPVKVRLSAAHPGYGVATVAVVPSKLTIIGPESKVQHTDAVVTDLVDITGVISSKEFHVNTYLDEPQVRFQSPSQVTVRVNVKKN